MKKSQGEIFGIALFFVVLIIGVIIYANIQALQTTDDREESFEERQYEILSADSLNALKKMSTGCRVEKNRDSLQDLIRYCFDNAINNQDDPTIECETSSGTQTKRACEYSYELLNDSVDNLFNSNASKSLVAPIPYSLRLQNPDFEHEVWHNKTMTNVDEFGLSLDRDNEDFYLRNGYERNNAGFDVITTGRREVELVFDIYYR